MKILKIILLSTFAVLLISCSKTPIQKKYNASSLDQDLIEIKNTISEAEFNYLEVLLDSLTSDVLQGKTYEEILVEGKKENTVFDRFEKRYLKKNKVKKLGKKLGENETEE